MTGGQVGVGQLFAQIMNIVGQKIHVGVVLAAGQDWVEVSAPEQLRLENELLLRFHNEGFNHAVVPAWRTFELVGFTYRQGAPPKEVFAGLVQIDPRSAVLMLNKS